MDPGVDYFEVIVENFLGPCGAAADALRRARERAPVVLHGVSLDLLGPGPLDRDHLRAVKALADRLDSPFVTDHLCWTRANGHTTHDLLPVPMSAAFARWAAERARVVQDLLERPFGLENLSAMAAFHTSSQTEWEFYRDVVEGAGCRYLLDVNNVYVSATNTGGDVDAYLAAIDGERVLQVHVAGHQRPARGPIVDTHDRPVVPEVWALYRAAWQRFGPFPTLLEWDDAIPSYDDALAELRRAEDARRDATPRPSPPTPREPTPVEPGVPPEVPRWQQGLLRLVTTPLAWEPPRARARTEDYAPALVAEVRSDGGGAVERLRAYHEQYWFRLLTALQNLYPTAVAILGGWQFNQLASAFLVAHPPTARDLARVGDRLPGFVGGSPWDTPRLREAVAVDHAWNELFELPAGTPWSPTPDDLQGIVDRRLAPSPTLRRLRLEWPLPQPRGAPTGPVGEAPLPEPAPAPATWLLFRTPELERSRLVAEPGLARLLEELDRVPLGEAVRHTAVAHPEVTTAQLRVWFEAGVRWGWWAGPVT